MSKIGDDALQTAKSFIEKGDADDAIMRILAHIVRLDARLDVLLGERDPRNIDLVAEAEQAVGRRRDGSRLT